MFADGRGSVFDAFSRSVDVGQALPSLFRAGETGQHCRRAEPRVAGRGRDGRRSSPAFPPARRRYGHRSGRTRGVRLRRPRRAGWLAGRSRPWMDTGSGRSRSGQRAPWPGRPDWGSIPRGRVRSIRSCSGLSLRTPESMPVAAADAALRAEPGRRRVRASHLRRGGWPSRLEVGRDAWPLAAWAPGDPAPPLTLHAAVHSVRVLGDAPPGTAVWLRPRRVEPAPPRGEARRVTRIGDVIVYSMDDDSYPDPAGVWTGGDRSTRLLLAAGGRSPIDLHLEAGPRAGRGVGGDRRRDWNA